MKAHDVAFQMVKELAVDNERPLTEQFIKHLNEVLLVRPFWKEAITNDGQSTRRLIKTGDYKEHPNSVRLPNGEMFEYASPLETPIQMRELVEWYEKEKDSLHVVTLAAMLHYKFVRIHPFDDGNGRISRLLVNYVLLKNGFPPLVIKSEDKANYLRALHLADAGDYEAFISYIGEQLLWSLQISIKAAKNENIEEDEDWKKRLHLLKTKTSNIKDAEVSKGSVNFDKLFSEIIFPFC
ncbi:Fic family protein [Niabella ginsengisoli]|uniref:Fic family protein n=1 Tax=Niabella ginsengisoli TaxID=522298 RepID=A0ABS9SED3_9BACT|nr:Fic family protein [Niabella ginsengisoli]MCH5596711.1 Fic family protein [Niabella ginsengisoli]